MAERCFRSQLSDANKRQLWDALNASANYEDREVAASIGEVLEVYGA